MRKQRKRYTGVIGIGDRIAFIMPGDRYITGGEVMAVDEHTLTVGNLSGVTKVESRKPTVLGGSVSGGPGITLTIQRGLVVENKSQGRRKKGGRRDTRKSGPADGGRGNRFRSKQGSTRTRKAASTAKETT